MPYTTRTEVPAEVNNYYDRTLLERLLPNLVFTKFGQIRDIPRKAGTKVIKFRKYSALSVATTPLTEGVTPAGSQLSVTDITATVAQYGDYITVSDVLDFESPDAVLTEAAEVLGEQAGETLDELARDILSAGTTVQYAEAVASRVLTDGYITAAEMRKAVATLQTNKAKKITHIVDPDEGYATSPINAAFIGIVGPKVLYTLKGLTGWIPVEKYANKADIMEGEEGAIDNIRFILTSKAKIFSTAGSGSVDIHATLILGANAYGISRISGEAIKNIVKPLGSAGSADPLDQRATSGWKATFVTRILEQTVLLRFECAVEI